MTRRALDGFRRWLALALPGLAWALACSVTPVPEPPTSKPKEPDLAQIDATVGSGILVTPVTITGKPGSVEPGVNVWIVNLDRQDQPEELAAGPDGSFQITLPAGSIGQELRLQTRSDDGRSDPVDAMIVSLTGQLSLSQRQACLTFEPTYELDFGTVPLASATPKSLKITNDCGADLIVDGVDVRVPSAPFAVVDAGPPSIPAGTSTTLSLSLTATQAGLVEEVLLVRFSGPFTERRHITLFGQGQN